MPAVRISGDMVAGRNSVSRNRTATERVFSDSLKAASSSGVTKVQNRGWAAVDYFLSCFVDDESISANVPSSGSDWGEATEVSVHLLRNLLSDIRLRLALIDEINTDAHDPELARLVGEIRMQEIVILAKLSELGIEI